MLVIDSHHHWMPMEHIHQIDKHLGPGERSYLDGELLRIRREEIELFTIDIGRYSSAKDQIKEMDEAGVDMAVLSTGLWQWWNSMELAPAINDGMADLQRSHPDRLIGLAHVPPFDPAAPAELERAVRQLGLRGMCLTTHCQGKYIDDHAYLPLYRKAAELGTPIFVHASPTPVEYQSLRVQDAARILGRVFDLSIAATRLAYSDVLDLVPGLTFVIGHLGGSFFLVKNRISGKDPFFRTPQADFEGRWKRIFFDSAPALWRSAEVACAVETLGVSQVLFGSDYPVMRLWMVQAMGVMAGVDLGEEVRQQVMGGTAARLLGIAS
ncbi:MAG: amidohydrolase family protein [Dehalococcoidia bacterium]|nr:amidohydrolase family protein [Dehalococcoidia bacterium]